MWDAVPVDSDLNPDAGLRRGGLFPLANGGFRSRDHAARAFEIHPRPALLSRNAQALVFTQKADEARKIFDRLPTPASP